MRSRRKPPQEESSEGGGWIVTFADLMTLLLTFFILIVAMSTLQDEKIKIALASLRGALGVMDGGASTIKDRNELLELTEVNRDVKDPPVNLSEIIEQALSKYSSDQYIQIGHTDDAVHIVLDDAMLFREGSSEVLPGAYPFLADVAAIVAQTDCVVEFHGHTDDRGGDDPRTNWEMGAARATSVLLHVQQWEEGVPEDRLRVISHADTDPLVPNTSAANRARNRRVEIKMITGSQEALDAANTVAP